MSDLGASGHETLVKTKIKSMGLFSKLFSKKTETDSFLDDQDPVQVFWSWFKGNEQYFFDVVKTQDNIEANFIHVLSEQLYRVDQNIFTLVGMTAEDKAELILTPDGHIPTIAFIEEMIAKAPALSNWTFTALKPAFDLKDKGIRMNNYTFSEENLSFIADQDPVYPDLISIGIIHPELNAENREQIVSGVFLFLDNYLGEYDFITKIDHVEILDPELYQEDRIPIDKLKSYLIWREKEFVEKYESTMRYDESNSLYSTLEGTLGDGKPLLAVMNMDLLNWDERMSAPWMIRVEFYYTAPNESGMPSSEDFEKMNQVEDEILEKLDASKGVLYIGRQTGDGIREVYLACKDFKKPSAILRTIAKKHESSVEMKYFIFKDKYWQCLQHLCN